MDVNEMIGKWEKNWEKIIERDRQAKENNELVGRYINEPYADGQAIYVITKELKSLVEIEVCTDIGDDWMIPYWGEKTRIKKDFALGNIEYRDRIAELFKKG